MIGINLLGDTLFTHRYGARFGSNNDTYIPSAIEAPNNKYLIWLGGADTCNGISSRSFALALVDTNFSVLWSKYYRFPPYCFYTAISASYDNVGNYLLSGFTFSGGLKPVLIKTNTVGDVIWAREYLPPKKGGVQFAKQVFDGNYMVGVNIDSIGTVLMKTDTSGNVLWNKRYNIPHSWLQGFLEDSDSTFLIWGSTDSSGNATFNDYALFIARLTKDGEVMWGKKYGDSARVTGYSDSHIIPTSDGNYAVTTPVYYSIGAGGETNTLLMKINNNGNVIWSVSHGDSQHDEFAPGLKETSDHGFILGGQAWGYYPGNGASTLSAQLIKTDSTGHAGCEEFDEVMQVMPFFLVDSPMALFPFIDSTVTTPGTVVDSTFGFGPFGNYVKCLDNEVWEEAKKTPAILYPNPNSGLFKISTGSASRPYNIESYYTVYDSMGRIILERALINEDDGQIDLSRFGKGLYLVRITRGTQISENKVLIE